MKKTLSAVVLAMMAGMAMVSCVDNKKPAANVEAEASTITEEVKAEAVELFKTIRLENGTIMQEYEVLPEGVRAVPVKFFVPMDWADKAQTVSQKCALLGCYSVDAQFDKLVYGSRNNPEARRAVIAKLVAEANIASQPTDIDSLASLDREAYISAIQEVTVRDFESALENNQADNNVTVLIYSVVEATLNREYANEQLGEYDQMAMIKDMKKGEKAMRSAFQLINLLRPYYESLAELDPLAEKIKGVLDAKDEISQDAAYLSYNGYIKQLRGKLNAGLEE